MRRRIVVASVSPGLSGADQSSKFLYFAVLLLIENKSTFILKVYIEKLWRVAKQLSLFMQSVLAAQLSEQSKARSLPAVLVLPGSG